MATGGKDGAVSLWNTRLEPKQTTRLRFRYPGRLLSLDGRTLILMREDSTVVRYDTTTLETVATNSAFPYARPGAEVAMSLGARRLAVGKPDGEVETWDAFTWDRLARWAASNEGISALYLSMDDSVLAVVNRSRIATIWNVAERRELARFGPLKSSRINQAEFSRNNKLLAFGFVDGTAEVWRLGPPASVQTFTGQREQTSVALSSDGRWLATANSDSTLKLWDLPTGVLTPLPRALMAYFCVAFSPDGRRIAAAGPDLAVRIIDTTTGEEVASLAKGREWAQTVRFSADGNTLLVLDDGGLTVWRAISPAEALRVKGTQIK